MTFLNQKIAGRKHTAIVDPSHSTSGPLQFYKKMSIAKFADGQTYVQLYVCTYGHTEKKVTSKDPFAFTLGI